MNRAATTISTANPVVSLLGTGAPTLQTWIELARTYVNYGIDHILLGADHLLFVLGLIWIVGGGWRLVKTITAFTIGHSASLAAAAFGLIGVPERTAQRGHRAEHRVRRCRNHQAATRRSRADRALSLGGGLKLRPRAWHRVRERAVRDWVSNADCCPLALLFFNIGVEIGQLAFVLLVLALIWAHRRLDAVLPAPGGDALPAYAIGSISMFWFLGRLLRVLAAT